LDNHFRPQKSKTKYKNGFIETESYVNMNVAAESLLAGWGFMASPALRMWAAFPDIQP